MVVIALAAAVGIIAVAMWRSAPTPPRQSDTPTAGSTPVTSTPSATAPTAAHESNPPTSPSTPTGTALRPLTPTRGDAVDPSTIALQAPPTGDASADELAEPHTAAIAWLSRTCPFDYREPFGTAESRGRSAMTDTQWIIENPTQYDTARQSWQRTVAAAEIGACSAPTATIAPEAPRTPDAAIVHITADRVVTPAGANAYVEHITDTRLVLRDPHGTWRVAQRAPGG
ncbi:hypothetical protein [Actinokineospora sp. HUAS TT18]|uniref:hypothetical protein n=1 Tax=Actinokineospora sp. HUAS TT18 TaxID=3447451 RepID=UPI003F51B41F